MSGYVRLGEESSHDVGLDTVELVSFHGADAPPANNKPTGFHVKVIYKERSHVVEGVTASSSVRELKLVISRVCKIEHDRIRLIHGGKVLGPDTASLQSQNVNSGTAVHLFPKVTTLPPLPVATPAAGDRDRIEQTTIANNAPPGHPAVVFATELFQPNPAVALDNLHGDPFIAQTCREVRLWSLILFMLSSLSVVNNFSELSARGQLGNTPFDAVVMSLETLCSILGIYVSQLGLASARTVNPGIVNKYVKFLTGCALLSVFYRVLWTIDIVIEVKRLLGSTAGTMLLTSGNAPVSQASDSDNGQPTSPSQPLTPPTGSDDSKNGDSVAYTKATRNHLLMTYTIRAVVVCLLCIAAWVSCWFRGVRLALAVRLYSEASTPPVTATATATPTAPATTTAPASAATTAAVTTTATTTDPIRNPIVPVAFPQPAEQV